MFAALFLFGAQSVTACSCMATPNLQEAFEDSDQVVIMNVLAVEKAGADDQYFVDGVKSAKMVVEKAYKGTLKVGDEISFGQGSGADCIWTFNEKSVGESYLLYLESPNNQQNLWHVFACGRSRHVKGAAADLDFLNNLDKLLGKTRIAGKLICYYENCPGVAQKKVRVIGQNKTVYETITDADGFYEIYDVPAGIYFIEPEIPAGWKVSKYWMRYSSSFIPDEEFFANQRQKQFPINLEEKKHAELNFYFEIDNAIRGRLIAPSGKPMKNTCVYAVDSESEVFKSGSPGCTDDKGNFSITELTGKNYVLVINGDENIRASQPFQMLFYPGVGERAKATVINISEGKEVKLKDFRVPKLLETVTITGKLFYSDGSPVTSHQRIQFLEDKKIGNFEPDPYDYTDDNGVFEIKIFKGQSGKIRAEMIFGSWQLDNCPDLRNAVIENNFGGSITATTLWTDVKADKDLKNVIVTFPFRECKRD